MSLIVSELVSNAVRHARGDAEIGLRLEPAGHWLRIEVQDGDPRSPQPRMPAPLDAGGLGFVIIEALASKWGADKTSAGKAVWAEVDIRQNAAASTAEPPRNVVPLAAAPASDQADSPPRPHPRRRRASRRSVLDLIWKTESREGRWSATLRNDPAVTVTSGSCGELAKLTRQLAIAILEGRGEEALRVAGAVVTPDAVDGPHATRPGTDLREDRGKLRIA